MTLGTWDPTQPTATTDIDLTVLRQLCQMADDDSLQNLSSRLNEDVQREQAFLMKLPADDWEIATRELSNDDLKALIRFFTVAERDLPGWEGGAKSPVIALNKTLKRRQDPLTREELQWIRSHSDNRFLPNGPL